MNKKLKFILLTVTFCFIIFIILALPINGNNFVPTANAARGPEPEMLTVLSVTGLYFLAKLRKK